MHFKKKVRAVWNLFGLKAIYWVIVGASAGCVLAVIEILLANFIQLFLKSLGMNISFGGKSSLFSFFAKTEFSISALMVFLGCIGLLRGLAMFTDKYSSAIAQEMVGARLRLFALHELLISENNRYVSASLINARFGEIFPKTVLFFYHISQSIPLIVQVSALLMVLFYISVVSTIIALLGLMLVAVLLYFIHKRLRKVAAEIPGEQQALLIGIERITRNWLLVRAFRTNKMEFLNLAKNIMSYSKHSKKTFFYSALSSILPQTFGVFLLICIIMFSISMHSLSSEKLISFLYLFLRMIQSLSVLFSYFSSIVMYSPQASLAAKYLESYDLERNKYFSQLIENPLGSIEFNMKKKSQSLMSRIAPPSIQLSGIYFRYDEQSPYIFNDLNLLIAPGEQVAFIGRSGSGKSTLLGIVFGLLKPEKGTVQINGMSASDFFSQFSDYIGYVGAEPFLIEGTIKENLDYGATSVYTKEQYDVALKDSSLYATIASLANGLEHKIEENGNGLSSGQKQRLSIARSLLRRPALLILDEITSNLDVDTEREIATTIAAIKGKSTVLMVSHRAGAICYADKVIDLSNMKESKYILAKD